MYCGVGTKKNKLLWATYLGLLVPTVILWILTFVYGARCSRDLEDQGVPTYCRIAEGIAQGPPLQLGYTFTSQLAVRCRNLLLLTDAQAAVA